MSGGDGGRGQDGDAPSCHFLSFCFFCYSGSARGGGEGRVLRTAVHRMRYSWMGADCEAWSWLMAHADGGGDDATDGRDIAAPPARPRTRLQNARVYADCYYAIYKPT